MYHQVKTNRRGVFAVSHANPPCCLAGVEAGPEGDPGAAGSTFPLHELPEAGRRRTCAAVLPHRGYVLHTKTK